MRAALLFLVAGFLVAGCQTPPTKTFESKDNFTKKEESVRASVISDKTLLVDARPPFAYALSHASGAVSIQWTDFIEKDAPLEGYLEKDLFFHARRLARLGIGPDTEVLVLGSGRAGNGEEGRLAWTFRRMGLKNVRFAALDSIRATMTSEPVPQPPIAPGELAPENTAPPTTQAMPAEVPLWKPVEDESLEVKRAAAVADIQTKKSGIVVIDVRPEKDYLQDADLFNKMNLMPKLLNVPWAEFLSAQGTASPQIEERLKAVGVNKSDVIYVIDERGVRSAGTTLILRDLGFSKAANWSGGFRELEWSRKALPQKAGPPKTVPKKTAPKQRR
ncbi:MAG: hypothetical protein KF681_08320 [Bdellovibrionaceae bacterium]|nr:hypothetical protein [Pseudobdellovibrionaceae bacterium]